jgi:hypothetical protein
VIFLPNGIYPDGGLHILRSPSWLPDAKHAWEAIPATPVPGFRNGPEIANALMVADLLRAIDANSKPCCNEDDGRWTIAMIESVYAAQNSGKRVALYNYRDKEQVSK